MLVRSFLCDTILFLLSNSFLEHNLLEGHMHNIDVKLIVTFIEIEDCLKMLNIMNEYVKCLFIFEFPSFS